MKRILAVLAVLATLSYSGVTRADEVQTGKVIRVATRDVSVE